MKVATSPSVVDVEAGPAAMTGGCVAAATQPASVRWLFAFWGVGGGVGMGSGPAR